MDLVSLLLPLALRLLLSPLPLNPELGSLEDNTAERGRSRSPAKDAPKIPVKPFQDKFVEVDCGGAGSCGYLCVAAALAMDKGEDFCQS